MRTDIDLKSAVSRWTNNRFNFRASFFTGRDPSPGDLSSTTLEQIYQGIKREAGQTEATSFAKFVARLKDLSASAFIQAFEKFWFGDCKEPAMPQAMGTGRRITGESREDVICEGLALFASAESGRRQMAVHEIDAASYNIKRRFIEDHREEIGEKDYPKPPRGNDGWPWPHTNSLRHY